MLSVRAGSALQEATEKETGCSSAVEGGVGEVEWLEDELGMPLEEPAEHAVSAGMGADSRLVIEKVLISTRGSTNRLKIGVWRIMVGAMGRMGGR